jgi:hypothetical protein
MSCWLIIAYGSLFDRYNKVVHEFHTIQNFTKDLYKLDIEVFCNYDHSSLDNCSNQNSEIYKYLINYERTLADFEKNYKKSICKYFKHINKNFMPLLYKNEKLKLEH